MENSFKILTSKQERELSHDELINYYCSLRNYLLYSKYNNFSSNPTPYVVSINYIVQEFNKFYKYSFNLIDSLTSNKLK